MRGAPPPPFLYAATCVCELLRFCAPHSLLPNAPCATGLFHAFSSAHAVLTITSVCLQNTRDTIVGTTSSPPTTRRLSMGLCSRTGRRWTRPRATKTCCWCVLAFPLLPVLIVERVRFPLLVPRANRTVVYTLFVFVCPFFASRATHTHHCGTRAGTLLSHAQSRCAHCLRVRRLHVQMALNNRGDSLDIAARHGRYSAERLALLRPARATRVFSPPRTPRDAVEGGFVAGTLVYVLSHPVSLLVGRKARGADNYRQTLCLFHAC